jgi:hypothetical protein
MVGKRFRPIFSQTNPSTLTVGAAEKLYTVKNGGGITTKNDAIQKQFDYVGTK